MPLRRAGKKDLRKNATRHGQNSLIREKIKTALKQFKKSMTDKNQTAITESLRILYKLFDRAASKKVIHRNKASRKKSRLAALVNKFKATKV
jgi:small subunit ribosomal protein S20